MTEFCKSAKISFMDDDDFNKNQALSDEDRIVWEEFTRDFMPEDEDTEIENFAELLRAEELGENSEDIDQNKTGSVDLDIIKPKRFLQSNTTTDQPPQLDKRMSEKLRKGKVPIEGRLDLHGYNQVRAYEVLKKFIIQAQQSGRRHVLVITGKGRSKAGGQDWLSQGDGVLKQRVPQWLSEKEMQQYVLKFFSAQPKDGGSGALYVYLRRLRD